MKNVQRVLNSLLVSTSGQRKKPLNHKKRCQKNSEYPLPEINQVRRRGIRQKRRRKKRKERKEKKGVAATHNHSVGLFHLQEIKTRNLVTRKCIKQPRKQQLSFYQTRGLLVVLSYSKSHNHRKYQL